MNSALEKLESMSLYLPVISIAKKQEEVFAPREINPLDLKRDSEASRLIQQVRDEAHQFAVSYHKKLRTEKAKRSLIDEIPGIGEKRKRQLLSRFGSINNLRKASLKEITETPFISRPIAQRIHEHLKKKK